MIGVVYRCGIGEHSVLCNVGVKVVCSKAHIRSDINTLRNCNR